MENECRSHGRRAVEQQIEGRLSLYQDDHSVGIRQVRDISPFGIGLFIDSYIATGCKISLRYRHDAVDIKVYGFVVWSSPAEPENDEQTGACWVGIHLRENDVLPNVEFFNAITA